jgi:hypothetical protein
VRPHRQGLGRNYSAVGWEVHVSCKGQRGNLAWKQEPLRWAVFSFNSHTFVNDQGPQAGVFASKIGVSKKGSAVVRERPGLHMGDIVTGGVP